MSAELRRRRLARTRTRTRVDRRQFQLGVGAVWVDQQAAALHAHVLGNRQLSKLANPLAGEVRGISPLSPVDCVFGVEADLPRLCGCGWCGAGGLRH